MSSLGLKSLSSGSNDAVSPFMQCYKASVLCHAPKEVHSNPFDGNGIRMVGIALILCLSDSSIKGVFLEGAFHLGFND